MDENVKNENKKSSIAEEIFEWGDSLIFAVVIVVLIFTFIVRVVIVSGDSMNITLFDGDKVIVSHLLYEPKQGDVIVTTDKNGFGKPLIKRVIATEGQTVDIDFTKKVITVDGVVYDDVHAYYDPRYPYTGGDTKFPVTVSEGSMFCMGDNRCNSLDSRFSRIGFISEKDIVGKAYFRMSPDFKWIKN